MYSEHFFDLRLIPTPRAPASRLLVNGALWIYWRLTRIFGWDQVEAPQVFKDGYGTSSTFLVGVIHGSALKLPPRFSFF